MRKEEERNRQRERGKETQKNSKRYGSKDTKAARDREMEAKGDEVEQKVKNTTVHSRFQFYGIWPNLLEMTSKQATTTAENTKKMITYTQIDRDPCIFRIGQNDHFKFSSSML